MFGKILLGILAIIFWPVTIALGALFLLWAVWATFFGTKDHYRAPYDQETGEIIKSFYMGGQWDEDDFPDFEDCLNAWMFLLSEAEDITPSQSNGAKQEQILQRAIHVLEQAILSATEGMEVSATEGCTPDLLYYLKKNDKCQWLLDAINKNDDELPEDYKACLLASATSTGVYGLPDEMNERINQKLDEVKDSIPEYSDEHLSTLANQFAKKLKATGCSLTIEVEYYETRSISKALSRFEWGGETVTQRGLAHWANTYTYDLNSLPAGDEIETQILDDFWEARGDDSYESEYGFLLSSTTANHNGKPVPVIVDLDEAPEYYVWTVSEGSMDYDVYEPKRDGEEKLEYDKATIKCEKLVAVFEISAGDGFHRFLRQITSHFEDSGSADAPSEKTQ